MSKAFTLIELLVVTGIIILLTALTLPNYRQGDDQLALQRSAHKMAQSLRMAQEYAISVKDFNGGAPGGYGIFFDLDQPDRYIMFADLDGNQIYSTPDEKAEEIIIEGNVSLDALNPVGQENSLNIFFAPPDPTIYFFPDAAFAAINIKVQDSQKSIQVNKAGLIAIE